MKNIFKRKNMDLENVENINLFSIVTENYTIQKYENMFYVKNNDTGYIEQVGRIQIKIK